MSGGDSDFRVRPGRIGSTRAPKPKSFINQVLRAAKRSGHVGTGGGLPGVVLAILRPDWSLTLIDPVHKKTAFLQQVKAQLSLNNLTVVTGKVEDLPSNQRFDLITSRAFASIALFVHLSHAVLADDGCFAAMKGVLPSEEISELQQAFANQWQIETHEIHVPQLNAQRHLVKISRINATHIHPKGTS